MRRPKQVAIAAAVLALALLLWWLRSEQPTSPETPAPGAPTSASVEPSPDEPPTLFPRVPRRRVNGTPVPPIERLPPPGAPVIDEVLVDKRSVCVNEDVRVTVKAHVPGGLDDAFLRYRVAGQEGPVVTLRRLTMAAPGPLQERGGYTVLVTGRDGTHASVPLPDIEVKECRLPNEFELVYTREPGTVGTVRLAASPIGHNPDIDSVREKGVDSNPRFQPVRYVWTFGDGTTEESTESFVVHDFGERPQTSAYSYFSVTCEAVDAKGQKLTASRTLELENPAFETFVRKGTVPLLSHARPAAVEDGLVTVPVRVWHQWASPITVKSVKVRRHRGSELMNADESHPPARPADEELFAALALGSATVPPGGLVVPVRFDAESDKDIAAKEFLVEGETPEGWPVKGRFVATRPDMDPVVRRMLVDRDWRLKVLRARQQLKKAGITEKEILDLEGEGLFTDLPHAFEGTPPPGFAPPPPPPSAED